MKDLNYGVQLALLAFLLSFSVLEFLLCKKAFVEMKRTFAAHFYSCFMTCFDLAKKQSARFSIPSYFASQKYN